MTEPNFSTVPKPLHVPDEAVLDFDYLHPVLPEDGDIYTLFKRFHDGPDLRWTPRNGGHWIVTRAEDVRWVQETWLIFSRTESFIPRGSVKAVMPPMTVDPPQHTRFRAVLNPFFTPKKISELKDKIRAITVELIEELRPRGGCEFVSEFAQVMPVTLFLGIMDLPLDRREELRQQAAGFIHAKDLPTRERYLLWVAGYLTEILDQRHAKPGPDLLSAVAAWRDNQRFGGEEEVLGMALVTFFGGLDTVANMMAFVARHLAQHPEHRQRIREQPDILPRAAEEYFRRHGQSNTARLIMRDVEHKGVLMKEGEMIMVPDALASLDERKYPDPFKIDFDRLENFENGQPAHHSFGSGPHRCIGEHLARAEVTIFIEEWLRRIPDFLLVPGQRITTHMDGANGIDALHLQWKV